MRLKVERRVRYAFIGSDRFNYLSDGATKEHFLKPSLMSKLIKSWFLGLPEDVQLVGFHRCDGFDGVELVIHSKSFSKVKEGDIIPTWGAD